jgi:hypothetical protein
LAGERADAWRAQPTADPLQQSRCRATATAYDYETLPDENAISRSIHEIYYYLIFNNLELHSVDFPPLTNKDSYCLKNKLKPSQERRHDA